MQIVRSLALLCLFLGTTAAQSTRVINEDFSTDPQSRGWKNFGTGHLIRWNLENQNVEVTWDSSQPNRYLSFPLETVLQRDDDFAFSLDLTLHDFAAGIREGKRSAFQIAFGFQNLTDASGANFQRAAKGKSPNLVEFNFMPDTGFGPTIWPAIFSTNGAMNYSGASDFSIFDLPTGVTMRVSLEYSGAAETAAITITANGELVGPVTVAHLATEEVAFGSVFTQFKVDTFSIASYSDAGYGGSILAHGVIDNVVIIVPPPPIREISGRFIEQKWEASFLSQLKWNYTLQSSSDLATWNFCANAEGNGERLTLPDLNPAGNKFYRVYAQRME